MTESGTATRHERRAAPRRISTSWSSTTRSRRRSAPSSRRGAAPLRWIMHSHIDLSAAQQDVWELAATVTSSAYDALVFEDETLCRRGHQASLPSHHPARPSTRWGRATWSYRARRSRASFGRYGIDANRPLISPGGAYERGQRRAGGHRGVPARSRSSCPTCSWCWWPPRRRRTRLAYAYFERGRQPRRLQLPDVHILSNLDDVGNVEVNVVQRAARVRACNGRCSAASASGCRTPSGRRRRSWRRRWAASRSRSIHGKTGYLADTTEEFADRIVDADRGRRARAALGGCWPPARRRQFPCMPVFGVITYVSCRRRPDSVPRRAQSSSVRVDSRSQQRELRITGETC